MLYVALVKGMRAHAEKVVFHSFECICRALVCVWSSWPRAGTFVGDVLHASSITGEGGRVPRTSLPFLSRSCGSEAKAGGLRCRAHFSFILGIARGMAPVITR